MTILFQLERKIIIRYVSHPIVDIMYRISTPTDIGVIIRTNDKDSGLATVAIQLWKMFKKFVSMRMYGCRNMKSQYTSETDF